MVRFVRETCLLFVNYTNEREFSLIFVFFLRLGKSTFQNKRALKPSFFEKTGFLSFRSSWNCNPAN
jgi:hypothetical protein